MIITKKCLIGMLMIIHQSLHSMPTDFSGRWCWDENSKHSNFSLTFKKVGDRFKGSYSAVILDGRRTDGNEDAFNFKNDYTAIVQTKLITGWQFSVALVQLKLLNSNQMEWLIIKSPYGEFLAPYKGTLTRC